MGSVISCRRLVLSWSNMNFTFVILLFTVSIVVFFSSHPGSFALQYSNYTSQKLLVQFQYPLTWEITEKNGNLDEGPSIEITDPFLGVGYIYLAFTNLSDYEAKNSSAPYLNIRDMTQIGLQSLKNDSSTQSNIIEYPSYVTIDGRKAGTYAYIVKDKFEDLLLTKTKVWIVVARDGYYTLGFGTDTDTNLFRSPEYTEMRDRFINSIRFLESDNSSVTNSTYLGYMKV
jgi:hypothetical protein